MKAVIFKGIGKCLTVEDRPDPKPGSSELVIKVARCGVCGTDMHRTSEHGATYAVDSMFGHEYSGEVVEVGKNVTAFRSGDLVTALPFMGCGRCIRCLDGDPMWCTEAKTLQLGSGFAQYSLAGASGTVKLPVGVSLADAVLTEPIACGLHGVQRSGLKPGDRVLVLGAGAIALTTIYWARRFGAKRIVVVGRSRSRADSAIEMGADAFVQSGPEANREIVEILSGEPDVVFECVGVPGMIAESIGLVRKQGTIVIMGLCLPPDTILPEPAFFKEVDIRFTIAYSRKDFETTLDVMNAGRIPPMSLAGQVSTLSEFPALFEAARSSHISKKLMLDPWTR